MQLKLEHTTVVTEIVKGLVHSSCLGVTVFDPDYAFTTFFIFAWTLSDCLSVSRDLNIRLTQASAVENAFRIAAFLLTLIMTRISLR